VSTGHYITVDQDISKLLKKVPGVVWLGSKLDKLPVINEIKDLLERLPITGKMPVPQIGFVHDANTNQWNFVLTANFTASTDVYGAFSNLLKNTNPLTKPLPNSIINNIGGTRSCSVKVPLEELQFDRVGTLIKGFATACINSMLNNPSKTENHNAAAMSLAEYTDIPGVSYEMGYGIIRHDTYGYKDELGYEKNLGIHSILVVKHDQSGTPTMEFDTAHSDLDKFNAIFLKYYDTDMIFKGSGYSGIYAGDSDEAIKKNAAQLEEYGLSLIWMADKFNKDAEARGSNERINKSQVIDALMLNANRYIEIYSNKVTGEPELPDIMKDAVHRISVAVETAFDDRQPATVAKLIATEELLTNSPLEHSTQWHEIPFRVMHLNGKPVIVEMVQNYTTNEPDAFVTGNFNELLADDHREQLSRQLRQQMTPDIEFSESLKDYDFDEFNFTEQTNNDGNTVEIFQFREEKYAFTLRDGEIDINSNSETNGSTESYGSYYEMQEREGAAIASTVYSASIQNFIKKSGDVNLLTEPMVTDLKREIIQYNNNDSLQVNKQTVYPDGRIQVVKYIYPNVDDLNGDSTATTRIHAEIIPNKGKNSIALLTETLAGEQWSLSHTKEIRNYGNLSVIKEINANDPDHFNLDVVINFGTDEDDKQSLFRSGVTAGAIGAKLGSTIGNFVSEDEIWKQLTVSPLLSTVGENLAEAVAIDVAQNRGDLSDDVLDVFNNADTEFLGHLRDAAGGAVSSLVTAELMRAIDAEGIGAELATSVSGAVLGKISNNLITIGANELSSGATTAALGDTTDLLSGVDVNLVGNAVGSYLGSRLAEHALAGYDSEEEAIGAQIGGVATGIATLFLVSSGPVGWLIAGLASFAGNFLGGTVGDLIHQAMPEKASAQLKFNPETGEFIITRVSNEHGGNVNGVKALANVASDAMENVLGIVGGEVINSDRFSGLFTWKVSDNLNGPGYFEKGTTFDNASGFHLWHNSVDDFNAVVEGGVIDMLSRLNIAGGDIYYKRALYNSLPTLMNERNRPIEDPLAALSGNMQIAREYAAYLENKDVINALIQSQPDSVFAAAWIATLARAAELGLNRRHASDFYGGWRYLLEQTGADVIQSGLGYRDHTRLIGLDNDQTSLVMDDFVDPESKTLIEGSGVIDLREITRALLGNLQRDGDLLIDTRNLLPDAYRNLRLEEDILWLGDHRLVQINESGIAHIYDGFSTFQSMIRRHPLGFTLQTLAQDLARGDRRLVDGQLLDVVAQVGDDGALTLMSENEALEGARLEDDELIREGGVIARVTEDGDFVPTHGEDIAVSAVVHGSEEADIIYSGDRGNDIFAGGGNDTVHGGANADWIYGGEGDDTLHAGDTDGNALFGEAGNDELQGGAGSDWLEGGAGDDRLYGGDGGDVLQGDSGSDYLEGGLGGDHYVIRRGDGETVIADHGDASEDEPSPRLSFGDIIRGVVDPNSLTPGSGDDEQNHDTLSLGPGITLDDLTYERREDDLVIQIAGGDDEAQESITLTDWFVDEGRIEVLEFAGGIRLPLAGIEQFINGTAGEDHLTLEEIEGSALINAMAGNDTIDLREVEAPAEDESETEQGPSPNIPIIDPVENGWGNSNPLPQNNDGDGQRNGFVVNGGDGNDTVHGSVTEDILLGGQGADSLEGGGGDDTLLGGEDNDNLAGAQGDDTLLGGTGDDELSGGAGADYLMGNSGNDSINGGAGSDTFEFGYADGQDSVNDIHQYEADDPEITTLLASIDGLLTDETATDEANSGDAVSGEAMADDLLSLIDDLQSMVDAGTVGNVERITESLEHLSEQLEADKLQMDRERLEPFMREFSYLALDSAGLLDIVNWTDGVEVGDLTIAWEGDDLVLELQNEYTEVAPETQQSEDQATPADSAVEGDEQLADAPGNEQQADAPGDELQTDAPVDEQPADAPGDEQQADAPGDEQQTDAPVDEQQTDTPADEQQADASADEQQTDAPADEQQTDAPGDEQQADAPAGDQQTDTPEEEDGSAPDTDAGPDRLRLQAWGSTAPYIERFDFTSGQVDVADIAQWIGGTEADDQLNGGDGHDWLTGGTGNDTLDGAAGDDIINGNTGDDHLQGDAGEDLLNGGSGDDQLFGGDGNDIIDGGSGDDLLSGGSGADTFYGGEGTDRVSYANADTGVRAYLDNGETRQIQRGLTGEVHEQLLGEGSAADRDALIAELLNALPDTNALIGEVADGLPLTETLKLAFTEALAAGQQETAIELLQGIFDSTSWILESDERTALLETIESVSLEPLPEEGDVETYWEQIAEGLPERGTLIDRIAELVPSRKEQGERLAALITRGDRAGLVSTINSWFSQLYGEEAQAKADEILALLPEQLPATRSPIENLETAAEVVESTDALYAFTSTGLNYGPEEEDTLGSFLGSDANALSEAQGVMPFDDLAVKLTGYIYLEAGHHDFTVTTNEGFTLSIGGTTFSEASGEEVSGDFETGFYRFELTYFDHQGEEELSVTSNSLADGNVLDASLFYTDPLQVDPRLIEEQDESGRSYLSYPDTDEQGDYFENVEGLIGSAHNDVLWGDEGDNQLTGGEGADTLHGGLGNDDLQGGNGNDRYEFGRGDGQDMVHDSAGDDSLVLGEDIAPEQLWLSRDGDDLALSVIGTNDKLTIADWYSEENNQLETITSATGESLLNSQVESLVHAMSAFSPPESGDATFVINKTLRGQKLIIWGRQHF
jgi:Ca2+-binding RTX toxin-like protein